MFAFNAVLRFRTSIWFLILFALSLQNVELRYVNQDLEAEAAEPRPIFVEPDKTPPSALPLVFGDGDYSDSENTQQTDASEKVEKVLQPALAFSYNVPDQKTESTDNKEREDTESAERAIEEDLNLENDNDEDGREKHRQLGINPVEFDAYTAGSNLKHNHDNKYDVYHRRFNNRARDNVEAGTDEHPHRRDHNNNDSGEEDASNEKKEDKTRDSQAAGSGHHGDHKFVQGAGKEHHAEHHGKHGKKEDKGYKGHHHHDKSEKGHHDKEHHKNDFAEKEGGEKHHHHNDGYSGEHYKEEEGKKGSKFREDGEHNKGHSTKGSHHVHKKEEFEKTIEFFDEDGDEGHHELSGGFHHESDYHKGGHHKSGHKKGGHEDAHHGKHLKGVEGGHHYEHKGHNHDDGHSHHHDHHHQHGEKEGHDHGKKWGYRKGTGNGNRGHHGSHSHVHQVHKKPEYQAKGDRGHGKESRKQDHVHNESKTHESIQSLDATQNIPSRRSIVSKPIPTKNYEVTESREEVEDQKRTTPVSKKQKNISSYDAPIYYNEYSWKPTNTESQYVSMGDIGKKDLNGKSKYVKKIKESDEEKDAHAESKPFKISRKSHKSSLFNDDILPKQSAEVHSIGDDFASFKSEKKKVSEEDPYTFPEIYYDPNPGFLETIGSEYASVYKRLQEEIEKDKQKAEEQRELEEESEMIRIKNAKQTVTDKPTTIKEGTEEKHDGEPETDDTIDENGSSEESDTEENEKGESKTNEDIIFPIAERVISRNATINETGSIDDPTSEIGYTTVSSIENHFSATTVASVDQNGSKEHTSKCKKKHVPLKQKTAIDKEMNPIVSSHTDSYKRDSKSENDSSHAESKPKPFVIVAGE